MSVSAARPAVAQAALQTEGYAALPRRQLMIVFAGLMIGLFLAALDQTIVGTAMPRIIADLDGFALYSWAFTAYMVASTAVVPVFGKLSDLYGRKYLFLGGIVVFLIASALCGLSQTMPQLIAFRGLQGVGAGVLMANAFAIIGDIFPPAERGKYQGIFGAVFGLAGVIGPLLGGFLTDSISWHWVFYVNIPIGIVAIAVLWRYFPHIQPHGPRRPIDWMGIVTLLAGVVPLLLGLSWAGNDAAGAAPQIALALGLAAVMLTAFVLAERRAAEPIMPLSLFGNRTFAVSIVTLSLTTVGMFGAIIYVPLFLQGILGASATESGLALLPFTIGMVVASGVSGQVISRTGRYRNLALLGLGLMAAGMWLLTLVTERSSMGEIVRDTLIAGTGMGITMPIFMIVVQNAVPYEMLGVVSAASQFFRSIGGTMGVALTGAWMAFRFSPEFLAALPAQVTASLSAEQLQSLSNPQALVSAEGGHRLQQALDGTGALEGVLHAMRGALTHSVQEVFLLGALAVSIAFVTCFFLPEIPLRKVNRRGPDAAASETAPVATH